ncbi:MAG TPA: DUF445 domain-containing protein [Bacillus sp. (in: firmicutes)]|nr:DUF445 domain-containing protein [Bacillus sp. (in: firmicutes)]
MSGKLTQQKKSKHLASISLAVMGTGFLATIPIQGSLAGDLLHGGFEAGLVGGLADWFAVTALFRHPLGLPIPHTALLPKNRPRVTKALVSTIENDWLSKESIQHKLNQIQFTAKILPILEKELHSDAVKKGIVALAEQMIHHVDVKKLTPFIEKQVKSYLSSVRMDTILQAAVDQALARGYEERALDYLLIKAEEWATQKERKYQLGALALKALDNIEMDGFLQFALKSFQNLLNEEKLGGIIQNLLLSIISSLRQSDNANRLSLLSHVQTEIRNIKNNQKLLGEMESWKDHLIEKWNPEDKLTTVLEEIQQKALAFVQDEKFADTYVIPFVTNLLNKLKEDPEKVSIVENWLQKQIARLVEENHSKIGKLAEENLNKLDDQSLIDMIENNVGKDLQWIRVNGAVCGFIIGIVLEGIKAFI